MSEAVTLSLRAPLVERIDVSGVTADRCALLSAREIASSPVWVGSRRAELGEFFDITGERVASVRVVGALDNVDGLAAAMTGGTLLIDGNAGPHVACGMTGGSVEVRGSVGDDAGVNMAGGVLRVTGNAGDRLGGAAPGAAKGMTGGEIVVSGSAGEEAGVRVRRGLIVVGGNVGDCAARSAIAGTLVVLGRLGVAPGVGNKRGSIVAVGGADVPPTYRYACTFEPLYVRLVLTYLKRRYGLSIDASVVNGRYRRYCGDAVAPGKGEILEWVPESSILG